MSHRTNPLTTTPTPDTLRLSRLDRLIDQLGDQNVTIRQQVKHACACIDLCAERTSCTGRQADTGSWAPGWYDTQDTPVPVLPGWQGVSVVDLAERLKSLESTVQTELTRVVQPLKVRAHLPAFNGWGGVKAVCWSGAAQTAQWEVETQQ